MNYSKSINLYIDKDDERQRELARILDMVPRSKTKFLALLIEDFKANFKDPSKITPKLVKDYMEYHDLLSQMSERTEKTFKAEELSDNGSGTKKDESMDKKEELSLNSADKMMSAFTL